jgi:hypothetical protein
MKTFCIAGPIDPKRHYFIPKRLNWAYISILIDEMQYFVLHAPRQSGKTTAIQEFVGHLNNNKYAALYINIEPAQAARDAIEKALIAIVEELSVAIMNQLPEQKEISLQVKEMIRIHPVTLNLLLNALRFIAQSLKKPLILFIDEIDSLIGDSLLSVLRQIRAGFAQRPARFPQSVCLIGLRDVRDYRVWSKEAGVYVSTSSPFNIKAISITLSNFSLEEVKNLYLQHTQDTGQQFTHDAIEYAYYLTQGQPWLVNALAYQACFKETTDKTQPITKEAIDSAKNRLIAQRDTHLDSLIDRLTEERVSKLIDAIINGQTTQTSYTEDDIQYAIDLGLISATAENLQIANPIYKEIIPAALAYKFQKSITNKIQWYEESDGSLNMSKLLASFTQFFRENSEAWLANFEYKESGPHILMMAFLQRILNGGGTIHREYALGKKRVDLLVTWKGQRYVIELKIKYGEDTLSKGLEQTTHYMSTSAATEGHLVIFDRDPCKGWEEKISNETVNFNDKQVHVWTM